MPTRSSKPHRDANQAAKHILDQLTGDAPKDEPPPVPVNLCEWLRRAKPGDEFHDGEGCVCFKAAP